MKRKLNIFITLSALWILMLSFSDSGHLKIPYNKIQKTIKKQFGLQEFLVQPVEGIDDFHSGSEIFSIQSDDLILGYVYVTRVNSCRMGGCSIMPGEGAIEFEYFDYYFITNSSGEVLTVKIFNYQATHGHQVMSKGWLKQFIGFNGSQNLIYGKNIQAISGATVSAKSIIDDIKNAEEQIRKLLNNYATINTL